MKVCELVWRDPLEVAIDLDGGKVYWAAQGARKIQRANLNGTNVEDVATGLGVGAGNGIIDLAIDVNGGKIYWTDGGEGRKIQRVALDGSSPVETIIESSGNPTGIALDPNGQKVYWTDRTNRTINRANLNDSNIETIITAPGAFLGAITLDVQGSKIFYKESGVGFSNTIKRADLNGTGIVTIVADAGEIGGFAVSESP